MIYEFNVMIPFEESKVDVYYLVWTALKFLL